MNQFQVENEKLQLIKEKEDFEKEEELQAKRKIEAEQIKEEDEARRKVNSVKGMGRGWGWEGLGMGGVGVGVVRGFQKRGGLRKNRLRRRMRPGGSYTVQRGSYEEGWGRGGRGALQKKRKIKAEQIKKVFSFKKGFAYSKNTLIQMKFLETNITSLYMNWTDDVFLGIIYFPLPGRGGACCQGDVIANQTASRDGGQGTGGREGGGTGTGHTGGKGGGTDRGHRDDGGEGRRTGEGG